MKPLSSGLARVTGRRRYRLNALLLFLCAVGILLASPAASRAASVSAPDSARTAVLRFAMLNFNDVRVVTNSTKLLGDRGVVAPDGLQLLVTSGTSISRSSQAHLVPWAEIESIQVRKRSGAPIVIGLVGGATLGWLLDHPGRWKTVYP